MRIGVFGTRDINLNDNHYNIWEDILIQVLSHKRFENLHSNLVLVHGGARGPQAQIVAYEEGRNRFDIILFPLWNFINKRIKFSTNLFKYRNQEIVSNIDLAVFFRGSKADDEISSALDFCKEFKVPYINVICDHPEMKLLLSEEDSQKEVLQETVVEL